MSKLLWWGAPGVIVVGLFLAVNIRPLGEPVAREGVAVEATGGSFDAGAECDVQVDQARRLGGYNCRITVSCAGQTLYGGERLGGYVRCDVEDGRYLGGVDDRLDGDPKIDLDLDEGLVVVEQREGRFVIRL